MVKKIVKSVLIILTAAAAVNWVAGFLLARSFRKYVDANPPEVDGMRLIIEDVGISPAFARFKFKNVMVTAPPGSISEYIFSAQEILVDIDLLTLFVRKLIVEGIKIKSPIVNIEVKESGKAVPFPVPVFASGQLESKIKKIISKLKFGNKPRKYPPLTIENFQLKNGRVKFIDLSRNPIEVLEWVNLDIRVPKYWRSLDYKYMELEYKLKADIQGSKGAIEISGKAVNDQNGFLNRGSLVIDGLDLNTIHAYNRKLLPVREVKGLANLKGDINVEGKKLDVPIRLELSGLSLTHYKEPRGIFKKVKKEMIDELLSKTNGYLELEFTVNGEIDSPQVNTKEIASQVIKQYLLKSAEEEISQKADKYGRYLEKKITGE